MLHCTYKRYTFICTKRIDLGAYNENRAKRDKGVYAHAKRKEKKMVGQNDE